MLLWTCLAAAPAAAGCTQMGVWPNRDHSNPAARKPGQFYTHAVSLPERTVRVYIDRYGNTCPDPAVRPMEEADPATCGWCLKTWFSERGGYDADLIAEDFSRKIAAMCEGDRTLIILIHGFNITYPEAYRAFKLARIQLERLYPTRKFAFLEVYWDGMYGSPLSTWPQAQISSKWVGLGLRGLLRRLDPAIPVRVITHSRGASVICAALWNTPMRGTIKEDQQYRAAQDAVPPPTLPGLRIGLLAPAMRPVDFECYFDRGAGEVYAHDRIVLGINPDDEALNAGGLPAVAGTTLGCSIACYDESIAPILNKGRARAFAVDFSGSVVHAFQDYLLRDAFEGEFLPKLLGDEADGAVESGR